MSWQRFPDEGLHEGAPRGRPAGSEEHSRERGEEGHSDRSLARRTDRGATVGERTGGAELDGLVCLPWGGRTVEGDERRAQRKR